jgi:hypothetical protein
VVRDPRWDGLAGCVHAGTRYRDLARARDPTSSPLLLRWLPRMGATSAAPRRLLHLDRPPAGTVPLGTRNPSLAPPLHKKGARPLPQGRRHSLQPTLGVFPFCIAKGQKAMEPLRPAGPRLHHQGQRHRSTASRQGVQRRHCTDAR